MRNLYFKHNDVETMFYIWGLQIQSHVRVMVSVFVACVNVTHLDLGMSKSTVANTAIAMIMHVTSSMV